MYQIHTVDVQHIHLWYPTFIKLWTLSVCEYSYQCFHNMDHFYFMDILYPSAEAERERQEGTEAEWSRHYRQYCRNTTPSVRTFCHCLLTKSHIWSLSNTAQKKPQNKTLEHAHVDAFSFSLAKLHSSLYLHRCFEYRTLHKDTHMFARDVLAWHKQNSHLLPFCVPPPLITHTHTDTQMEIWPLWRCFPQCSYTVSNGGDVVEQETLPGLRVYGVVKQDVMAREQPASELRDEMKYIREVSADRDRKRWHKHARSHDREKKIQVSNSLHFRTRVQGTLSRLKSIKTPPI